MSESKLRTLHPATVRCDPIWQEILDEARLDAAEEPLLASFLHSCLLNHDTLGQALSMSLANNMDSVTVPAIQLREIIDDALASDSSIAESVRADLSAVRERDPACQKLSVPLLYYKGFHAIQAHRVSHWLWNQGRESLALFLQNRISVVFDVDIHPAARVGNGIMIDHATGVVVGETAVIGDDVSMLHGVTLGGTGKTTGDRHPKISNGVLIGASATVLGNVSIGENARIGAGSVVLNNVEPGCTVAGVPAQPISGPCFESRPARDMDHRVDQSIES